MRPAAPQSISDEARTYLESRPPATTVESRIIPIDDVEGWERLIAEADASTRELFVADLPPAGAMIVDEMLLDGVTVFGLRPSAIVAEKGPLFLDVHGGGLIQSGGELAWMTSAAAVMGRIGITWVPD